MYAELELKICTMCKKAKDEKEFSARNARKSKKASWCKSCLNEWRRQHKLKNKDKYKHYEFVRGLRRNYGLTLEQYDIILKAQDGKCAIGSSTCKDLKRGLHVDHDKHTGQVRGILCGKCNPGIGYFDHSTEKLEMAVKYLNKFKK